MILSGLATLVLFGFSLVSVLQWLRSTGYEGGFNPQAFQEWLSDPKNTEKMEPLQAFSNLWLPIFLALTTWLFGWLRGRGPESQVAAQAKAEVAWAAIRGDLILTVRKHWIDDWLHHSLYRGVRIHLGVEKKPDAIDHPFTIERASGERLLLKPAALLQLYDECGGMFVIQGKPGSGKTFTLVQLAGLLLDRAKDDPSAPVPVIVPLASWAMDELPLDQWLAAELHHHYSLSTRDTPGLLAAQEKRLILLLDGLDEVRASARDACARAILEFHKQFHTTVVLCCRVDEYEALPVRPSAGDAIRVLPLSPGQIEAYLSALGADALMKVVKADPEWQELTSTPLMLNILAVVHGSGEPLPKDLQTPAAWQEAIFRRYVKQMFQRKERRTTGGVVVQDEVPFTSAQAIHWLQQLAKRMVNDQVFTFYIERMQPRWVRTRWKYKLTGGLIFGLIGGLIVGLIFGLIFGLMVGMMVGLMSGMFEAMIFGLTSGLFTIELVERVRLRSNKLRLIVGLICGVIGGLVFGVIIWLTLGPIFGLFFGLVFGLFIGLIELKSHPQPSSPNQGVRKSFTNSLIATAIFALLGAGIGAAFEKFTLGYLSAYFGGFFFGGMAVLEHYSVRLALAWEGVLPYPLRDRQLVRFLDAMRDRLLLTRVGGGWMFIHRQLLDFLANEPFGTTPAEVEQILRKDRPSEV